MALALITGASSGLGRDFAQLFSKDGHDLVLVARREDRLRALAYELNNRYGVSVRILAADLRQSDAADRVADAVSDLEVDFLVNNAGFGMVGAFASTDVNIDVEMIQLHVVTTTKLTKLLLTPMLRRARGRVLNVASVAAFLPGPYAAVYYATKAYILSWSEALAEELRDTPITVTVLCPGRTATEFATIASLPDAPLLTRPAASFCVASEGYRAMYRGQRVVVPGMVNKAITYFVRLTPRTAVTRVTRTIQRRA